MVYLPLSVHSSSRDVFHDIIRVRITYKGKETGSLLLFSMMDESKLRTEITDLQARLEEAHGESKGGRPCKYKLDDIKTVVQLKQQGVSIRKTAKRLGMAPSTVQKLLAKAKKMQLLDDLLPATKE